MHSDALVLPSGRTQTRRVASEGMDTYPNRWGSAASLHDHSSSCLYRSGRGDADMQKEKVVQVEEEQSPP